jgi:hypothetical protein
MIAAEIKIAKKACMLITKLTFIFFDLSASLKMIRKLLQWFLKVCVALVANDDAREADNHAGVVPFFDFLDCRRWLVGLSFFH